jgi:Rps23 Pro-64 3,4-dihydroxylase Tpa1-like proline 4-hydroxylase
MIGELLTGMQGEKILSFCKKIFHFEELYGDPNFDGGGLTITNKGGFLRYHADFPYSNLANRYRVINAILYLSTRDIQGGNLHLIDYDSGTVEASIQPKFGTIAIFPTSKYTQHGVSRILEGTRVGINAYFYANAPLDDRVDPSKTLWMNNQVC